MEQDWQLPGCKKDSQSITSDWELIESELIDGVRLHRIKHVVKQQGHLTEVYRADWALDDGPVDQVFQAEFLPGQISAWHAHEETRDRLFVSSGTVKIVLFDNRPGSPSRGRINEFRCGILRPLLILIPPRVWHGVQNIGNQPALVLNLVDRAYQYTDPDHWRIPADSTEISYSW